MHLTRAQLDALYELTVVSDDGHTLGPVGHIYLDDDTQEATWVTAKTGLFGLRERFVPIRGARVSEGVIKVRYTKDYIGDAPRPDTDGHLTTSEQDELFRYYRLRRRPAAEGAAPPPSEPSPEPAPAQQPGPIPTRYPQGPPTGALG